MAKTRKVRKQIGIKGYKAVRDESTGLYNMTWTPKKKDKLGMSNDQTGMSIGENMTEEQVYERILAEDYLVRKNISRDLDVREDGINERTLPQYLDGLSIAMKDKLRIDNIEAEVLVIE